jgi:hypothetical protein
VVAVRHLRKGSADRAIHRGLGSIDFAAAARSVLLVARDPEQKRRRIVAHVKSSTAVDGDSLAFELEPACGLVWAGTCALSADDLQRRQRPAEGEEDGDPPAAQDWLEELLARGPLSAGCVKTEASAAGFAWRTVQRARERLGVRTARAGFGAAGEWVWSLGEPLAGQQPSQARLFGANGANSDSGPVKDGDEEAPLAAGGAEEVYL